MSHAAVRAREGASGIVAKFLLLSLATVVAFFALPFHNAYRLPRLPSVNFEISAPVATIRPDEPSAPEVSKVLEQEMAMSSAELLDRWKPFIAEASRRFGIPEKWIRAVVSRESGGRTVESDGKPITSDAGAIGVMQVMPDTYDEMRAQYDLGADPADPHDNIIAGSAYLHWLYKRYGFPDMFAAYNDGPGNFDKYRDGGRSLPAETVAYLASMTAKLDPPRRARLRSRPA